VYFIQHLSQISFEDDLWLSFAEMGQAKSVFARNRHPHLYAVIPSKFYRFGTLGLESPLFHVVRDFQSERLIKRFITAGYDINDTWRGTDNATPLYFCCRWKSNLALLLLELGANPNSRGTSTCLQEALENEDWVLYEKLMAHPKIDIEGQDYQGRTILHHLVEHATVTRLSSFLDSKDCNVNAQDTVGYTPLHCATVGRKLDKMKVLLDDYRIRLDVTDVQGRTSLTMATYWGYRDAALLIMQSTTAFPIPREGELSPLTMTAKHGQKDMVLKLLSRYSNLNPHIDTSGKGILHHCAINDWPDVIGKCLTTDWVEPTNINQIDHPGMTALHYAASLGNVASVRVLLEHGASVRFQDRNGRTAAIAAADSGFQDTLLLLIKASGTDAGQKDNQGRTLVHWAASCDWVDVFDRVLTLPNADLKRKDRNGVKPLGIAVQCGCPNVVNFIIEEIRSPSAARHSPLYWERKDKIAAQKRIQMRMQSLRMQDERDRDASADEDYYKVPEVDLLMRVFKDKARNEEWEDIARQYPAEQWAMAIPTKPYS
jgi:ankyrin repeat protein